MTRYLIEIESIMNERENIIIRVFEPDTAEILFAFERVIVRFTSLIHMLLLQYIVRHTDMKCPY